MKSAEDQSNCTDLYYHIVCVCVHTHAFLVSVNGSTNYCTGGAHTHGEI